MKHKAVKKELVELTNGHRRKYFSGEDDGCALLGFEEDSNNDSQLQSQYFRWSPDSTRLMLRLRFDRQLYFQQNLRQKKELWSEIAMEMQKEGHLFITGEVCDLKYRNMLQTYKKNRLKEERGLHSMIMWEYYELFKESMATIENEEELVPTLLCESVCIEKDAEFKPVIDIETMLLNTREMNKNTKSDGLTNRIRPMSTRHTNKRPRLFNNPPTQQDQMINGDLNDEDFKPDIPDLNNIPLVTLPTASSTYQPAQSTNVLESTWYSTSELHECKVFGDSVGLQLAHVKEPKIRALLQLKIQELIYMAKMGKLGDKSN